MERIIVSENEIGMSEESAQAIVDELFLECKNCQCAIAKSDRKIMNYEICEKCWKELTCEKNSKR